MLYGMKEAHFFSKANFKHILVVSVFSLIQACGTSIERHDSAPAGSVDVSRIPNAVPKAEPKSKYGNPESYVVNGKKYYVMGSSRGFMQRGIASWYGTKFHGRRTSSGETYDMYAMTAAHKQLPLPTYVEVTNMRNGMSIIVKINDRGPFHDNRIIDLSYAAAMKLDIAGPGTGLVEIRALTPESYQKGSAPVHIKGKNSDNDGFYIQVGSFTEILNARKLKQKLGAFKDHSVHISEAMVSGSTLYRVRIGPINNTDMADQIVASLREYGIYDHHIVLDM